MYKRIVVYLLCMPLLIGSCTSANPFDELDKDPIYGGKSGINADSDFTNALNFSIHKMWL